jgi:hypothetical protein
MARVDTDQRALEVQRNAMASAESTLGDAAKAMQMIDAETADFGDYTLRLTRSEDRRKFELSLAPKQSCDLAFFSNDKNIVYTGHALGCSEK